jgi:hypothetical protein
MTEVEGRNNQTIGAYKVRKQPEYVIWFNHKKGGNREYVTLNEFAFRKVIKDLTEEMDTVARTLDGNFFEVEELDNHYEAKIVNKDGYTLRSIFLGYMELKIFKLLCEGEL